jgi:hypothetical protein
MPGKIYLQKSQVTGNLEYETLNDQNNIIKGEIDIKITEESVTEEFLTAKKTEILELLTNKNKLVILTTENSVRVPILQKIPEQETMFHFKNVVDIYERNKWLSENISLLHTPPDKLISMYFTTKELTDIFNLLIQKGWSESKLDPLNFTQCENMVAMIKKLATNDNYILNELDLSKPYFLGNLENIINRKLITKKEPYAFKLIKDKSAYMTALEARAAEKRSGEASLATSIDGNNIQTQVDNQEIVEPPNQKNTKSASAASEIVPSSSIKPEIDQLMGEINYRLAEIEKDKFVAGDETTLMKLNKTAEFESLKSTTLKRLKTIDSSETQEKLRVRKELNEEINKFKETLKLAKENFLESEKKQAEIAKTQAEEATKKRIEAAAAEEKAKAAAVEQEKARVIKAREDAEQARQQHLLSLSNAGNFQELFKQCKDNEERLSYYKNLAPNKQRTVVAFLNRTYGLRPN